MSSEKRQARKKTGSRQEIELSAPDPGVLQSLDDKVVSRALHHGDLAPVVRYLREIVAPAVQHRIPGRICGTNTVGLLADMLEGRESTLWHLKRVSARRGKPTDVAATTMKNIRIGASVQARLQSGTVLKAAIADVCEEFEIKPAHAYKCLELYKTYRYHDERGEPMPIPERPRRRRVKTIT
jgi:hypothetical protein